MKNFVVFVVTFCVIQSAICDESAPVPSTPVSFGRCIEDDFAQAANCVIDSIAIEGCKKDSTTCKVKRNRNATIVINFTPDFDSTNDDDLEWMAYALLPGTGLHGKSMPDMNPNACKFMTCPIAKGVQAQYRLGMKLPNSYPIGSFNTRFIMKYAGEPRCCFFTKIRIEK